MNAEISQRAAELYRLLKGAKMTVSTAESCTGGMVSAAITAVPGASDVFREAYVVYADEAKSRVLGVSEKTLVTAGSVSCECAGEMASNLVKLAHCDLALSVTGYAGPTGGTEAAPVGTVWFGIAFRGKLETFSRKIAGDRDAVRANATVVILQKAIDALQKNTI